MDITAAPIVAGIVAALRKADVTNLLRAIGEADSEVVACANAAADKGFSPVVLSCDTDINLTCRHPRVRISDLRNNAPWQCRVVTEDDAESAIASLVSHTDGLCCRGALVLIAILFGTDASALGRVWNTRFGDIALFVANTVLSMSAIAAEPESANGIMLQVRTLPCVRAFLCAFGA